MTLSGPYSFTETIHLASQGLHRSMEELGLELALNDVAPVDVIAWGNPEGRSIMVSPFSDRALVHWSCHASPGPHRLQVDISAAEEDVDRVLERFWEVLPQVVAAGIATDVRVFVRSCTVREEYEHQRLLEKYSTYGRFSEPVF